MRSLDIVVRNEHPDSTENSDPAGLAKRPSYAARSGSVSFQHGLKPGDIQSCLCHRPACCFILAIGKLAHNAAQNIETIDGSYWHAIIHRQEPDAPYGNAVTGSGRVGIHPVFPGLREDASEILSRYPGIRLKLPAKWDPAAFTNLCETAVEKPGSELERAAIDIQHAEWKRLFDWCVISK